MNQNLIIVLAVLAVGIAVGLLFFYMGANDEGRGSISEYVKGEESVSGIATEQEDAREPEEVISSAGEASQGTESETPSQEETPIMPSNSENPIAILESNMGTIKMELYVDLAPITAGNFVKLVDQKFYDGLIFHRIIEGFMIQGGDPNCVTGDGPCGAGGPGWAIPLEIAPELKHGEAGMVAMARSQDPDSAGSQFYITLGPQDFLDGNYAVFGKVLEGLDVVMAMGSVATNATDRPLEDVIMERVYLEE